FDGLRTGKTSCGPITRMPRGPGVRPVTQRVSANPRLRRKVMAIRLNDLLARIAHQFDERLETGNPIGPYRVEAFLAKGGMGRVYRVADVRLAENAPRRVIKVISEDFINLVGEQAVRRFELEANILARLDDPGIVRLYEFSFIVHPHTRSRTPFMV